MSPKSLFPGLMHGLFRQMNIATSVDSAQEIYTVHLEDEPDVHFICRDTESLDVICEAGRLNSLDAPGKLLGLLELNGYDRARFTARVTIHRGSGMVMVWSRQPLAGLDAFALMDLLQSVRLKVHAVRLLDQSHVIPSGSSGSTLSHILRAR